MGTVANTVAHIQKVSGLTDREMSLALGIHPMALALWDGEAGNLTSGLRRRLGQLDEVTEAAHMVMTPDHVREWLMNRNDKLGSRRPIDVVPTEEEPALLAILDASPPDVSI